MVRYRAAGSLAAFGQRASNAVPALVKELSDPDVNARQQAAAALREIDPDAKFRDGAPTAGL